MPINYDQQIHKLMKQQQHEIMNNSAEWKSTLSQLSDKNR
jgi:hypothetical protein